MQGYLKVKDGSQIWYRVRGEGRPVLFLHGGPGSSCHGYDEVNRELFLEEKGLFRLIEFDQRGCGKSRPGMSENKKESTLNMLKNLRIDDLALDIEDLRTHLGIEKWLIFGGSWGSTLGLRYAQKYPDAVDGLILRGIFLSSRKEMDSFFSMEGRKGDPHGQKQLQSLQLALDDCTDRLNPEAVLRDLGGQILSGRWETAIRYVLDEKNTMTGENRLISDLNSQEQAEMISEACHHAALIIPLAYGPDPVDLLEESEKLPPAPVWIIHGTKDPICPVEHADALARRIAESARLKSYLRVEGAGHSCKDPGIMQALKGSLKDYQQHVH